MLRNDKLIAELRAARRRRSARRATQFLEIVEDGPHRAAGRRADDGRPGVPRVRGVARGRDRSCCATPRSTCTPSTWAPRRSAPASTCRRATPRRCAAHLAKLTGKPIVPADGHVRGDLGPAGLRRLLLGAEERSRSSCRRSPSDLILLASGPRAGLSEINLPALQPGSSIMPGKVNPVIPELMNLVAFRVMGNDCTRRRSPRTAGSCS